MDETMIRNLLGGQLGSEMQLRGLFVESCAQIIWDDMFSAEEKKLRDTNPSKFCDFLGGEVAMDRMRKFVLANQQPIEARMFRFRKKCLEGPMIPGIQVCKFFELQLLCRF